MRLNVKALLLFCVLPSIGFSQKQLGMNTSNWTPSQSLLLNPALAANKDLKFVIDLGGLNFGVDNDAAKLHTGKVVSNYLSNDDASLDNMYVFSKKQNINMLAPYATVRGPGFLFSIKGKHSIGMSTRLRAMNQLNNFNIKLYRSIADQDFTDGTEDYQIVSKNASWSANVWSDIGFTYAATIADNGVHRLKAGVTFHILRGVGYMNAQVNNLDAYYYSGVDSLHVNNADLKFSSNIIKNGDDISSGITGGELLNKIFGSKAGGGFGTDIGIVYEYNPNHYGKNTYLVRTSLSITDIGSMSYNTGNTVVTADGSGYMYGREIDAKMKNYEEFRKYAEEQGIDINTTDESTKMSLPTTMILGADLHMSENTFINVTYVSNLRGKVKQGNSYYNQLTITPRYDTELLGLGMPITLGTLNSKMKMGMYFRVSGLYVGSDDLLGSLGSDNQYGINVYCGANIPLFKHYKLRKF